MKKRSFDIYFLLSILFTIIVYGFIFWKNDIYPFGKSTITLLDFDSGYIPVYYKLWDVLHLKSSAFFDWNLGAGLNSFGSLIGNGFISPLCWVIGLFKRSSIPYTISYVYLLKIIFISIMTYIGISKTFPKSEGKYKMMFTLLYTLSAYMFLMSTNLLYLDSIALFPLLVYSLKELLDKGKWKLYTFLLVITLLMSYYIAWLDLLFIICFSALYLLILKPEKRKERASKLFICTVISLLLSCVLFLPGVMLALNSARMTYKNVIHIFSIFGAKFIYLITLAIPFVLTVKQLFVKKDRKINIFIILMLILIMSGVFLEPINALWHTGSHSGFPLRYGYQITYFTIMVSLYYINNNYKPLNKTSIYKIIIPLSLMALYLLSYLVSADGLYFNSNYSNGYVNILCALTISYLFIILIVSGIMVFRNSKNKAYILSMILIIMQSISFGYIFLQLDIHETSVDMQKIKDDFELINDNYNYVKNDISNINFPYILNVPSKANRLHFIREEELNERDYLGFGGKNTIVTSDGGNVFTNALVQNKYYITPKRQETKLYDLISEKDGNYYLKSKYNLKYLIPYNGNVYNEKNKNIFENANQIYKSLFDGKNNIYDLVNYEYNNGDYIIHVKKGYIYQGRQSFDPKLIDALSDLGEETSFEFEYNKNEISDYYDIPTSEYSGMFGFESKVDGDIVLHLDNVKDICFYELNLDEYRSFIEEYGNIDVNVSIDGITKIYDYNAKKDGYVLLPINYTDEYEIKINGKKVDYSCNLYNMISIYTNKGENKIEVTYKQKWFVIGIIITLTTLVLSLIGYLLNKKYRFLNNKIIVNSIYILCCLIFAAFILKIYVLSFFQ